MTEDTGMFYQFLQQFSNGLVLGMAYALMAIGLTMIFGLMEVVNFAHGELYMMGAFFAFSFAQIAGVDYYLSIVLAIAGVMLFGFIFERLALKPLRGKHILTTILLTIGLSIFLQNTALIIWGPIPRRMPTPFVQGAILLGPVWLTRERIFAIIVSVLAIAAMHLLLRKTKLGRAMRATFQVRDAAALMGVNINRICSITFALGSGLAALAGTLLGSIFLIQPEMGKLVVLKAFTVVILGGLGSFVGAVCGGLILGVAESLGAGFISTGYKDAIGFVFVIVILLLRPAGLFGKTPARS
jgi:branched-chain amino acid transport system permease protein